MAKKFLKLPLLSLKATHKAKIETITKKNGNPLRKIQEGKRKSSIFGDGIIKIIPTKGRSSRDTKANESDRSGASKGEIYVVFKLRPIKSLRFVIYFRLFFGTFLIHLQHMAIIPLSFIQIFFFFKKYSNIRQYNTLSFFLHLLQKFKNIFIKLKEYRKPIFSLNEIPTRTIFFKHFLSFFNTPHNNTNNKTRIHIQIMTN